jgi:hypothetical protein
VMRSSDQAGAGSGTAGCGGASQCLSLVRMLVVIDAGREARGVHSAR